MNAVLALLQKLDPSLGNPSLGKSALFRVLEYIVLIIMLYGLYADATGNLLAAKSNRDEQIKGYAVQMGLNHTEVYHLKDSLADLEEKNKELTARINRLEDKIIRGH